jgi:hypothetical protein
MLAMLARWANTKGAAMILKPSEQSIETRRRIAEILSRTMPIPFPRVDYGEAIPQRVTWNIGDDQNDEAQEAEAAND